MSPTDTIQCPHCSATYRLTEAMAARAGKEARCALCGNLFIIPANTSDHSSDPGPTEAETPDKPASGEVPESPANVSPAHTPINVEPQTELDEETDIEEYPNDETECAPAVEPAGEEREEPSVSVSQPSSSANTETDEEPLIETQVDEDLGLYSLEQIETSSSRQPASSADDETPDEAIPDTDPEPATSPGEIQVTADKQDAGEREELDEALASLDKIVDELETLSPDNDGENSKRYEKVASYGVSMRALRPDVSHQDEEAATDSMEDRLTSISDETIPQQKPRAGFGWWLSGIILSLMLAAQLGWQYRQSAFVYNLVSTATSQLGYPAPVIRSPESFQLTNRLFTRVENSSDLFQLQLQITNMASWPQPYPEIELTLTDKHGITRVRQNLGPELYLKNSDPGLIEAGESADISFVAQSSSGDIVGFSLEFL